MEDKYTIPLLFRDYGKRFEKERTTLFKVLSIFSFIILFIGVTSIDTLAQRTDISGKVTDANDNTALPGVNILVPGTTIGTTTDFDGNYTISVPNDADSLTFRFIGYIQRTVAIDGRTTINIALAPDVQQLEDVVVVGYGSQERKQITGSVSSVKSEDFVKGAVNTANSLIEGKVPGLTISTQGANPNSDAQIRLRGVSSFGGNQEPLVVIDGIIGGNLDNVDPNDIESIEVLKDASASAIYGTRGSAGVILVTTRKGSEQEKASISYNGYITGDFIEKQLDVLSADEFRQLGNDLGKSINDLGGNTDWIDEITQTGLQTVHSLSISGGSGSTNYRISGNFREIDGIQKRTGFQSINGRFNLTQKALDDNLELTFNLSATDRDEDIGFGSAFRYAAAFNPTAPVKGADIPESNGSFRDDNFANTGGFTEIGTFDTFNPVSIISTGRNFAERKNFNGAFRADYDFEKIVPGLSASVFYSLETINTLQNEFYETTNKLRGNATASNLGTGRAVQNTNDNSDELIETTVSYKTDINKLNLDIITGYSWNNIINEGSTIDGGDFIADAVGVNNFSFAQDFDQGEGTVSSFKNESTIVGGFGRVSMRWDDTYFLNGSVRREASSRFGENEKWGTFWSVGGGLEITEFIDIPKVSALKLRASFGETGQNAPLVGLSQLRFAPLSNFFVDGNFVQSFGPVSNPNPDLKWETKEEFNIGVDFELFQSRLSGTVEFYSQDTEDLLFPVQVSVPPNLFPTTWENVGALDNSGVEFSFTGNVVSNDKWNWNSTLNSTVFGDTELTEFVSGDSRFISNAGAPGLNETDMIRVVEGGLIGDIWGPKFSRFAQEGGETINGEQVGEGAFVCVDPSGNEFACVNTNRDREQVLGNGLPEWQFGFTNDVSYKNFDFSLFIRGVFGHDMANTIRIFNEPLGRLGDTNLLSSSKNIPARARNTQPQFTSRVVEDAGFLRIQNLTLGYTMPFFDDISSIKRLRVYFSANNLATITGYNGVDPTPRFFDVGPVDSGAEAPEVGDPSVIGGAAGGALAPGIDRRNNWFTARSFTLGINLDL